MKKTKVPEAMIAKKPKKVVIEKPVSSGQVSPRYRNRISLSGSRFIFTAAQNNTPVHAEFFANLVAYATYLGAQLVVGRTLYNLNAFQKAGEGGEEIWFDNLVKPFLLTEQAKVCDGLIWCGDVNILPTTRYPLSSMEQYTGHHSSIFPASSIQMESVATSKNKPAKLMYSTGSCTQRNFTKTKAGNLGDSRLNFGALVVEVSNNGQWFARQIETDESGTFCDLRAIVDNGRVQQNINSIVAVNLGDIHAEKTDPAVMSAVLSMIETLQPDELILHDLHDFTSRNHHSRKNPHFVAEHAVKNSSVKKDLQKTAKVLQGFVSTGCNVVVVESNHDQALTRWLQDPSYSFMQDTPENALAYLQLQGAVYGELLAGKTTQVLPYALKVLGGLDIGSPVIFLQTDESYLLAGEVEAGIHGHTGINGSRGSPRQFQKLNMPVNTGHTHSASINGQVYTAGCMNLEQDYNVGPSSWSISHILTYANGMRTVITMQQDATGAWQWCAS